MWNLTFSWYQSLRTISTALQEAGRIFRWSAWLRFRYLALLFAAIGLLWNSMVSWAGGSRWPPRFLRWETATSSFRDSDPIYLKEAAAQGNAMAMVWGLAMLILVIVVLDQLTWRPLLA